MDPTNNEPVELTSFKENSNSQKSSSSSKSLNSFSSHSSGYGQPSTSGCSSDIPTEIKRKDNKKKKVKKHTEMRPLIPSEQLQGSKTHTMMFLSHAFSCMKKVKNFPDEGEPIYAASEGEHLADINFKHIKMEFSQRNGEGFVAAVSLHEGIILHITNSISDLLGYPKDMLVGRSFIDFLLPKDRIHFSAQLAIGLNVPFMDKGKGTNSSSYQSTFHIRIRIYRGLTNNGFSVTEKKVIYRTFEVTLRMLDLVGEDSYPEDTASTVGPHSAYVILTATPISSAYKNPEEIPAMTSFTTRHTACCHFSHIDNTAIPYFGYLPQDMTGNSVFNYYHPEDLPHLKEVYEQVIHEQGRPFRSKPYRFRIYNGNYILLETEWSCFINPWQRKLEFVIGQHRVLKGPLEPNIFLEGEPDNTIISEEVLKESKNIQDEILQVLSETLKRPLNETNKHPMSKRRKDLGTYMVNLIEEMVHTIQPGGQLEGHGSKGESCSNQGSVVMGEISPHHQDSYSNPSSETPPSYNHINYTENIQRYFDSQPKTQSSDESGESKEGFREMIMDEEQKSSTPVDSSSTDGSGNQPCASNSRSSPDNDIEPLGDSKPPPDVAELDNGSSYCHVKLTEETLSRHNEMTKKFFVQQHREHQRERSSSHYSRSDREGNKSLRKDQNRLKRTGSHSPIVDSAKVNKQSHTEPLKGLEFTNPISRIPPSNGVAPINLWPPFSMTTSPVTMTSPASSSLFPPSSASFNPGSSIPSTFSLPLSQPLASYTLPMYTYLPSGPHSTPALNFEGAQATSTVLMPVQYVNSMSAIPSVFYHPVSTILQPTGVTPSMIVPSMTACSPRLMTPPKPPLLPNLTRSPLSMVSNEKIASYALSPKTLTQTPQPSICSSMSQKLDQETSNGSTPALQTQSAKQSRPLPPADVQASVKATTENDDATLEPEMQDELTGSSLYSFLKSDKSDDGNKADEKGDETMAWENQDLETGSERGPLLLLRKDPPWLEDVTVTSDLIYRYQVATRDMVEVLRNDLEVLKKLQQPELVNDQLAKFYEEQEQPKDEKGEFFGFSFDTDDSEENFDELMDPHNSSNESEIASPHEDNDLSWKPLQMKIQQRNSCSSDVLMDQDSLEPSLEENLQEDLQRETKPSSMDSEVKLMEELHYKCHKRWNADEKVDKEKQLDCLVNEN